MSSQSGTRTHGSALPTVFIGSSSEALEIAEYLQDALESARVAEATIWKQGFFQLPDSSIESLVSKAADFDFAVMIMTADTKVSARGREHAAARANVLFEIGLFIGLIGRKRTFIVMCEDEEVELPSDLHGAMIAKYPHRQDRNLKAAMNAATIAIREAIRNLGPRVRDEAVGRPSWFVLSDSGEFVAHVENLLLNARRVTLIGAGLNILHRDPVRWSLMKRAATGECQLEIYLADPFSPSVENRLIEEEAGEPKPPVGKAGLVTRIDNLLDDWQRLGSPKTVQMHLFSHYPTFALLIIDGEYFFYPYGYATLGNFSPVIQLSEGLSAHAKPIQFFRSHVDRVRGAAVDAGRSMQFREGLGDPDSSLHAFAIYFVPPKDSPLYEFGSQILGRDVRKETDIPTDWTKNVGVAPNYGFHLTVCDSLYFLNAKHLDLANHEAAFIARDYSPFQLTNLRVESQFPDAHSIAIGCDDPSGTLEALHAEFVMRIYRRAAASDYTLGTVPTRRDKDECRAELMIRRFHAPYILQRYRPHFSLLTAVRPRERLAFATRLQKMLAARLPSLAVLVDKLAIMGKASANSKWRLIREVQLG